MRDTLVDTNVLLDISEANQVWFGWSSMALRDAANRGELVVNPVVYSELASGYARREELEAMLMHASIRKEELPWDAAFMAGLVYRTYRGKGGERTRPLPDFYIGAHASVRGYRLLTRDRGYYRGYFPTIEIISPDTHP